MTTQFTTREQAQDIMTAHYSAARKQLANAGSFGKKLDYKARKLALRLSGECFPPDMTIAWATPDGWGSGPLGYRASTVEQMQP